MSDCGVVCALQDGRRAHHPDVIQMRQMRSSRSVRNESAPYCGVGKRCPPRCRKGMGALSSVVISREICNWQRFNNRRQVFSRTGLCPGEYNSGSKRVARSVTKHGNNRKLVVWKIHWFDR